MIKFEKVTKKHKNGTIAVSNIDLKVEDGEFIFLTGPTGAGKSTLIRLLIRDLLPTEGSIKVDEFEVEKLPKKKIPHLRRKIGVIFQELKLLTDRTVHENIAIALEVLGNKQDEIKKSVEEILDMVGLKGFEEKFPLQLSGGELRRTAIARAIIKKPKILLADEPTADLDPVASWEIIKIMNEINKTGTTIIMATHNLEVVNSSGKRVITLDKGRILKDQKNGKYETK